MQIWQINSLELEASGLKLLDDFIREHPLCFLIGAIYLLLALLAGILGGALRRKGGESTHHVRPAIIIHLPEWPPPAPETFDPFPPYRESSRCDCDDHYHDCHTGQRAAGTEFASHRLAAPPVAFE
jgi:hypothetical protein